MTKKQLKKITKQLLESNGDKKVIDKILEDNLLCMTCCDKEHCLFKELYDYRFDGCCIAEMNDECMNNCIKYQERKIESLEYDIEICKEKIARYKEYKNKLKEFKDTLEK